MQRIELGHLIEIAAHVLGVNRATARSLMDLPSAEATLDAPFAGSGEWDAYPTFAEKVGVLGYRLARNHVLVDGNKRVALLAMIEFVERNGYLFDDSDQDDVGDFMEAAAAGTKTQLEFISWVSHLIKMPATQPS